jgi:hypothetical protein
MEDFTFICVYWHEKGRRGVARQVGKRYKDLLGEFSWAMVRDCITYQPRDTEVWVVFQDFAALCWPTNNPAAHHLLMTRMEPPKFPEPMTVYDRLLWAGEHGNMPASTSGDTT